MKHSLKLEEALLLILGIYFFNQLDYQWWWFLVLILVPDIGMIGYAFGNKIGAISYNIFHHRGLAVLLYLLGMYFSWSTMQLAGIILFSHIALERFFGYGLKYSKGFRFTHLGEIGNNNG